MEIHIEKGGTKWCPCCEKQMSAKTNVMTEPEGEDGYLVITCLRCRIVISWQSLPGNKTSVSRFGPFRMRNFG